MLSDSENTYTHKQIMSQLNERVKSFEDSSIFEYITKLILNDQPKNEIVLELILFDQVGLCKF